MPDSNHSELDAKHERNARERLEGVMRWVEYIKEEPPEVWGPQQNKLVDTQLQSARETGLSVEHEQQVRTFAAGADETTDDESGTRRESGPREE
jgi:hypothetical protein